jgi:hypothetical protein
LREIRAKEIRAKKIRAKKKADLPSLGEIGLRGLSKIVNILA